MSEYILELKNISKYFPGIKALDDVNFQLKAGKNYFTRRENLPSYLIKYLSLIHI